MAQPKILYGIDLGTTNSAIAKFTAGMAVIQKSPIGGDTTPSCVTVSGRGRLTVGQRAYQQLSKDYQLAYTREGYKINSFIEFKRVMGTDEKIHCDNLNKDFTPEELSAEVLKELRKYVLDDDVKSAVITVPAMFDNNQKDATKRAAKLAGLDYFELIQEPVAASIAYGLESKVKDGYWLVFDFGGGTFDVALMKIEDGIMKPIDTAGNNHLGGKDIDAAIVDEIIIPYLEQNYSISSILESRGSVFKQMWKPKAEEAKIALSGNNSYYLETELGDDFGVDDNGEPLELSIEMTQDSLESIAAPIYQKAVDITKQLLEKNHLDGNQLSALILVGGPTHSPIIRRMLRDQITENVDTSIDPMTCVACGAAMYASTLSVPEHIVEANRDTSKIQLAIDVKSTSVEQVEYASIKLLTDKCDHYKEDHILVELVRSDGGFNSGKISIDTIGDVIDLPLLESRTNVFAVRCYNDSGDLLECEPNEITVIQGIDGIGDAIMPMDLGIGVSNDIGDEVFKRVEGCEKNQLLPANGQILGLITPKDIRPGIESDYIRISLYQLDEYAAGIKAIYCNHLYDLIFTGDDIPALLPMGSEINIRLHADKSGTVDKFVVNIPYLDIDIDITERMTGSTKGRMSDSFFKNEVKALKKKAKETGNPDYLSQLLELEKEFASNSDDRDRMDKAVADLKRIGKSIDSDYASGEWERTEKELRRMYNELKQDNDKYGNADTTKLVEALHAEADKAINSKDISYAKEIREQMWVLDYKIAEVDYYIAWIVRWNKNFDSHDWTDRQRARQLVNKGLEIISDKPTADSLRPIANELNRLLPISQRPNDILTQR